MTYRRISVFELGVFSLALGFALGIQGAIPFFLTPTLGQAVWTTGFSQSFINESLFSIFARNIGAPEPAAIAFGLAGAWPTAVFIKLGLHAADAYSAMIALWIIVAFTAAYGIARYFYIHPYLAILAAFCWVTMPVIWAHAGYSMVSTGISLFSLYFFVVVRVVDPVSESVDGCYRLHKKWLLLYPVVCIISVFMDGYSFMMFAVGSSIFIVWIWVSDKKLRKKLVKIILPFHVVSFAFAYFLYSAYIGKPQFEASPIDFFRGLGVDLIFLLVPTQGMHWLPDIIGWSVARSGKQFFGDASVWMTSFSIPVIIGAIWAVVHVFQRRSLIVALALIGFFSFYMALGPSLKFNSIKPSDEHSTYAMPEKYAIAPTGSAFLSENVPGFKNMRASYRWCALGIFSAWALLIFAMSSKNQRKTVVVATTLISIITLLNLPHLSNKWQGDSMHRKMFLAIEHDLVNDFRKVVQQGEKIAFLPWRNDFLVNYIASRLNVISFNIGGDKNLSEAVKHWPTTMRSFPMAKVDKEFSKRVLLILTRNEVDAVIFPYIDMLWAAHRWPYPVEFKQQFIPVVSDLSNSGFLEIQEREFYAVIRLKSDFASMKNGKIGMLNESPICILPKCLQQRVFSESTPSQVGVLYDGKLHSTGKAGFISFGPYAAMQAGRYRLIVRGSSIKSSSAWVDVASDKGTIQHSKFSVSPASQAGQILAEGFVVLESAVSDIEIRVYVGAEDQVTLEGYELVPVANDAEDSN